jgi:hypothetical protein
MTKNLAGLMLLVLAGAWAVNAAPITVDCSLTGGDNSVTSTTNSGTPTTTGTYTCTLPTLPAGNSLTSLDLIFDDDYSLGTIASNNEVEFSYSTSDFTGATSLTTEVIGFGGSPPFGVSSTTGNIVGQSGTPTCSEDAENAFDCQEPAGDFTSTSTFTVTGSTSWVMGSLQDGGKDDFSISYAYTYAPTPATPVPEPATLMLVSSVLAGLALAARRRRKAQVLVSGKN